MNDRIQTYTFSALLKYKTVIFRCIQLHHYSLLNKIDSLPISTQHKYERLVETHSMVYVNN